MAYRRIIVGDSEIRVPEKLLTMGLIPMVLIILFGWLSTGIYMVGPDEVGVVRTFGEFTRVAQPGLNYHFPSNQWIHQKSQK